MYVISETTLKISVRNLVEFIFASGDIDNRNSGVLDLKLMQEGVRIHKKIQHGMGALYHAEVPLKIDRSLATAGGIEYTLHIEGRADGIIADMDEDAGKPVLPVVIDEIKTVQTDVEKMKEAVIVHKAQAMVYGYIYASMHQLPQIHIQMTYCNPDTERMKRFKETYTFEEIEEWFANLENAFKKWSDYVFEERTLRLKSIEGLEFPFPYRQGQKKLTASVYKAIEAGRNLYIQAPTGVGKTMSTLFPAVWACKGQKADKIFYLTSKTITRTVAEDAYKILRQEGLHFKTITLTAKDKICCQDERNCNPAACAFAKGHFDRVNEAVYDLITHEDVIGREKVLEYSAKHKVCPFEMSLDASYWCDGIICDYNYVFDPDASLKRYFGEANKGRYIFLVDEAHNLVDRARQMYSASLVKEDFLKTKKCVRDYDKKLYNALEKCNRQMLEMKRTCDTYQVMDSLGKFHESLLRCYSQMQKFMEAYRGTDAADSVAEFFFSVRHFLNMADCMDEKYVIYTFNSENGEFFVRLFCADPSGNIEKRLGQGVSTIFFSATLLPVNYFKEMLSGNAQDYAVYARSPFHPENKRVIVGKDVSSRYTRRNSKEYRKICTYISAMTSARKGNYIIFFPSYSYMKAVFEMYIQTYPCHVLTPDDLEDTKDKLCNAQKLCVVMQDANMKERQRENFLELFHGGNVSSLVAFCVLGGIFSEGIDLKDDSLIGTALVGTGLPMICRERDILKNYFDAQGKNGYEYAYVFPGMNKILQAAGRVIRTDTDRGIIMLLDDRFLDKEYESLFPLEWDLVYTADEKSILPVIQSFWKTI